MMWTRELDYVHALDFGPPKPDPGHAGAVVAAARKRGSEALERLQTERAARERQLLGTRP